MVMGLNKPVTTSKVEKVIARILIRKHVLVRAPEAAPSGSRLHAMLACGDKILVHKAPVLQYYRHIL